MSKAQLEKFMTVIRRDPATLEHVTKDSADPQQLIEKLVQHARTQGYEFTSDEASAWFSENIPQRPDGELSDAALGDIAGGAIVPGGGIGSGGRNVGSAGGGTGGADGTAASNDYYIAMVSAMTESVPTVGSVLGSLLTRK